MTTSFFTRRELCRSKKAEELGIPNECPDELNAALARTISGCDRIRGVLGFPMRIHSGYRSPGLNVAVGGAIDSQHTKAEAVDFTCPAFGPPEAIVAKLAPLSASLGIDQLIVEPGWVHVSFTERPRFQILRMVAGRYSAWKPIG